MKSWNKEMDDWLVANYRYENIDKCAEHFGKSRQAIMARASRLNIPSGRFYSKEQVDFIENNSELTNAAIARRFNRSELSIRKYRYLNNIGTIIECNDNKLTQSEVARLVGKDKSNIQKIWVKKRGLKTRSVGRYKMCTINELFRFMQDNPDLWSPAECDVYFFQNQKWFMDRKEKDFNSLIKQRWGEFYEVV